MYVMGIMFVDTGRINVNINIYTLMFISYLERIMDNNDEETTRGIIVHGLRFPLEVGPLKTARGSGRAL